MTNKTNKEKVKHEKLVPTGFVKHIEIDKKRYLTDYIVVLSIACAFLLAAVVTMIAIIRIWWVWIIDLALLGFCVWRSVNTCFKVNKHRVYTLYENCLVVDALTIYAVINLKDVYDVCPVKNLMDKFKKNEQQSLAIFLAPNHRHKVTINYISEDLAALTTQIKTLAEKQKVNDSTHPANNNGNNQN